MNEIGGNIKIDALSPPWSAFQQHYPPHLQHLKLNSLRPKTIEAYVRAVRRVGDCFHVPIDSAEEPQLLLYFSDLAESHSRSAVKLSS